MGRGAAVVAGFIAAGPDAPMPHAGYSEPRILFLIRNEAVEHLDDLLLRRTTLAIAGELSLDMIDAVLDLLAS